MCLCGCNIEITEFWMIFTHHVRPSCLPIPSHSREVMHVANAVYASGMITLGRSASLPVDTSRKARWLRVGYPAFRIVFQSCASIETRTAFSTQLSVSYGAATRRRELRVCSYAYAPRYSDVKLDDCVDVLNISRTVELSKSCAKCWPVYGTSGAREEGKGRKQPGTRR